MCGNSTPRRETLSPLAWTGIADIDMPARGSSLLISERSEEAWRPSAGLGRGFRPADGSRQRGAHHVRLGEDSRGRGGTCADRRRALLPSCRPLVERVVRYLCSPRARHHHSRPRSGGWAAGRPVARSSKAAYAPRATATCHSITRRATSSPTPPSQVISSPELVSRVTMTPNVGGITRYARGHKVPTSEMGTSIRS